MSAQPKGSRLREGVVTDEYLTLQQLAAYSKVSVRQLKRYLARGEDPLPHVRNGVRPLVLRSSYDAWIVAETARRHHAGRGTLAAPRTFRDIMQSVKAAAGVREPLAPRSTSPPAAARARAGGVVR